MSVRDEQNDLVVVAALDRHDQRRRCGIPVVSVLVGLVARAQQLVDQWAKSLGRPVVHVQPTQPDPEGLVIPWVAELAKLYDLRAAAVSWLAQRLGHPTGSVEGSIQGMTQHEIRTFLELVLPLDCKSGIELVVRRLIAYTAGVQPGGSGIAPELNLLLDGYGRPWIRVFRAMGELVSPKCLPFLIVSSAGPKMSRLDEIARLVAELATAQPRTGLALLVEPRLFNTYVELAPASRAKALLRESAVTLTWSDLATTVDPLSTPVENQGSGSGESLESARNDWACKDRGSPIRNLRPDTPDSDSDEARSAAERCLYERLQSVAETTGLFELNTTLDFHFGLNRWIEVDLTARSLKLVVEVDGYHHFQDLDAYRRDRRKDLELQKHGYLVVRVLADDVLECLEDVMGTILAAVAFRRAEFRTNR
jgi:Protein of unknown function (DUF559)